MELWIESGQIAWRTLRTHPLRTALVALSVAIGSGGISLLVSLGKSGVDTILNSVEEVGGARLIFLYEKFDSTDKPTSYDAGITLADVTEIRRRVPGIARASFLNVSRDQFVFAAGKRAEADIAVGADWMRLKRQTIGWGTSIPGEGDMSAARVVVIAEGVADKLYGAAAAAVGQTLTLWGHHYRIVGVAKGQPSPGFNMGAVDHERAVYMSPYAATKHEGFEDRADDVLIESDGTVSHDLQMRLIDAILLARHRVVDWELFDFAPLMSKFEMIFLVLRAVIGVIAAVALFIAGAGVMNVLLASVQERVGEIGIRRAMGANKQDVRRQFLVESATLAALGGGIGAGLGGCLAWLIGQLIGLAYPIWQTRVSVGAALAGVAMALLCGLVFGLVPARRAARLDVVACLRGEV